MYKARNGKTGKLMALKRIRMKTEKDGVRNEEKEKDKSGIVIYKLSIFSVLVSYYSNERNQIITKIKT